MQVYDWVFRKSSFGRSQIEILLPCFASLFVSTRYLVPSYNVVDFRGAFENQTGGCWGQLAVVNIMFKKVISHYNDLSNGVPFDHHP